MFLKKIENRTTIWTNYTFSGYIAQNNQAITEKHTCEFCSWNASWAISTATVSSTLPSSSHVKNNTVLMSTDVSTFPRSQSLLPLSGKRSLLHLNCHTLPPRVLCICHCHRQESLPQFLHLPGIPLCRPGDIPSVNFSSRLCWLVLC